MTVVHTGGTYINDRYNWHFCITLKIVDVGDTPTALPRDRFGEIIRNVAAERSCSFPLMDEVSEYITEKVEQHPGFIVHEDTLVTENSGDWWIWFHVAKEAYGIMLWVPEVEYIDDRQADRRAVAKERLARFQDEGLVPRDSTYVLESIVVSLEKEQQKENVIFTDYSPAMAYLREKIDDLLATVAAFPYKEKFLRVTESWEKVECGFITGFRGDFTSEQNRQRNEELFRELDNSGLSLIKAVGRFTETTTNIFCVINTRFTAHDFIEFMVHLCEKYEQETVLVTVPVSDIERRSRSAMQGKVAVEGRYYDRAGTLAATFNDVTFAQVEAYFAGMGGQKFMLVPDQDAGKDETAYYIKAWHDVYSVHGHCLAEQNFRQMKEGWGGSERENPA